MTKLTSTVSAERTVDDISIYVAGGMRIREPQARNAGGVRRLRRGTAPVRLRASQLALMWAILALEPVELGRLGTVTFTDQTTLSRTVATSRGRAGGHPGGRGSARQDRAVDGDGTRAVPRRDAVMGNGAAAGKRLPFARRNPSAWPSGQEVPSRRALGCLTCGLLFAAAIVSCPYRCIYIFNGFACLDEEAAP